MVIALHAFFQKYRIETSKPTKRIYIHYRIKKFNSNPRFLRAIIPIFVIISAGFFYFVVNTAGDQKWARGQLEYDGFQVLWRPK